jgi:hypothetical protein
VVARGDDDEEVAVGLLLPEPHPARSKPTVRAPPARSVRFITVGTIRPSSTPHK